MRWLLVLGIAVILAGCAAPVARVAPTALVASATAPPVREAPPPPTTPIPISALASFSAQVTAALQASTCPGLTAWAVLFASPGAAPGTCTVLEGTLTSWSQTPGNYLIATPAPGGPAIAMLQWGGLPLATANTVYTVVACTRASCPASGQPDTRAFRYWRLPSSPSARSSSCWSACGAAPCRRSAASPGRA
jgi:hypothetical protein